MPINGLQVDIKPDELKKILRERLDHHEAKSIAYANKAAELKRTIASLDEDMEVGKATSGDPSQSLEQKSREHGDKANYYRFMLDHVIQDDVYRLGQQDLERLGIAIGRFY